MSRVTQHAQTHNPANHRGQMSIELSCRGCGSNRFTLAHAVDDDSDVSCEDCGHHVGTLAELKTAVVSQVMVTNPLNRTHHG